MRDTPYYSTRTGKNSNGVKYDLPILRRLFKSLYERFLRLDYFQECLGYYCVDEGDVPGKLGSDIGAYLLRRVRKASLWPIRECIDSYSDDDIFDLIEFLHDCVSKPISGHYHTWNNCGWHYDSFDQEAGRQAFRVDANEFLGDYGQGYELTADGEIVVRAEEGLASLLDTAEPSAEPENVDRRVESASAKFRRRASSGDDKRDAVRDLADVLEYLRPRVKSVIASEDEGDLFNLANNFGVRHHNKKQKTDYDTDIWYDWMFYYYLATIHACRRLLKKAESQQAWE